MRIAGFITYWVRNFLRIMGFIYMSFYPTIIFVDATRGFYGSAIFDSFCYLIILSAYFPYKWMKRL